MKAQEVYNMVLQSATRIVNSPTSNFNLTRIAQFKRTALTYMRDKAFEKSDSVSANFLDTQAYCLSEFTTLFFNEIFKVEGSKRKDLIYTFMKASLECPMWNDPDKETSEAFIAADELTPFSLDTDWEKALAMVQVLIHKE